MGGEPVVMRIGRWIAIFVVASLVLAAAPWPAGAAAGWARGPDMIFSRRQHVAVALFDGRVLVAGGDGYDPSGTYGFLSSVEIFDPATDSWTLAASMWHARIEPSATLLADGRVLVVGGSNETGSGVSSAEIYDPALNSWRLISAPPGLGGHSVTRLADGRVLMAGGCCDTSGGSSRARRSTFLFDPGTLTWREAAPMQVRRAGHSATLLPADGRILVVGGWGGTRQYDPPLEGAEIYDPSSDTWTMTRSNINGISSGHQISVVSNGDAIITGGCCVELITPVCLSSCTHFVTGTAAQRFDPRANAWVPLASQPTPRFHHSAITLSDGRILIAGGRLRVHNLFQTTLATSEFFDPGTGLWTEGPRMSQARERATVAALNDGRVMLIGGVPNDSADMLRSVDIFTP